ncbi:conserved hypothetical protein [Vibrio parahaemolyticus AQ3810]|nr:conserved hypothetical protein [Vibrio parahaemolyticus AQ3810]
MALDKVFIEQLEVITTIGVYDWEKELTPRSSRFIWRTAILLMALITLAALGFYYMHWDILSEHIQ